jgi:hypothetical protein
MANWCSNQIAIISKGDGNLWDEFFAWLESKEDNYEQGWHPEVKDVEKERAMFCISQVDDESFGFESKWDPAIITMRLAADKYQFSFTLEYEEGGNGLYGMYYYDHITKVLKYKYLENIPEWTEENDHSYYDTLENLLKVEDYRIKNY